MKRLLLTVCVLVSSILCYAQRYTGYGRGYDSDSYSSVWNNITPIVLTIIFLAVVYYIIRSVVNRKPTKERVWDFNEFRSMYSKMDFISSPFDKDLKYIVFSGAIFREDATINYSRYISIDYLMESSDYLQVVQTTDGKYKLREKR